MIFYPKFVGILGSRSRNATTRTKFTIGELISVNRLANTFVLFILLVIVSSVTVADSQNEKLETSICGLKEPILFWLWSATAGRPDPSRLLGQRGVEDVSFVTRDGRTLRGYKLRATIETPRGFLLVLQGNAILADQILSEFRNFAQAGYDVFIYDFRGYGHSEGKRRLKAIVSDYKELLGDLGSQRYPQRLVYAMSLGGVFFLNALDDSGEVERVVIDSSPSRLSTYGCPLDYDPVEQLPEDCSGFLFVVGANDNVVSPGMSRELVELAAQRGAKVQRDDTFSHPFMDRSWDTHSRRMRLIENFLLQ